jgi:predicted esterase
MRKIFTFLILLSFASAIMAQTKVSCTAERYEKDLFPNFNKQTVEYAVAKGWQIEKQPLLVDIYEPRDDQAVLRPLIIMAHGGSFIGGTKEQVAPFCTALVKKGYVTASIQYRLLPLNRAVQPDSILREVVRAINDMKAAIRFFRQSAAEGNPYKIDPNHIFIGGVSAGAITALHAGILDEKDLINSQLKRIIEEEGGWTGDTGLAENRKYSAKVSGIINLSGSIMDGNWIGKNDAPIFSYHGTNDMVVPINFKTIGNFPMYGSEAIKQKADSIGVDNLLIKVPNGGHTDIYSSAFAIYLNDFQKQTNQKIRQIICGNS